jgi:hypothetical protein
VRLASWVRPLRNLLCAFCGLSDVKGYRDAGGHCRLSSDIRPVVILALPPFCSESRPPRPRGFHYHPREAATPTAWTDDRSIGRGSTAPGRDGSSRAASVASSATCCCHCSNTATWRARRATSDRLISTSDFSKLGVARQPSGRQRRNCACRRSAARRDRAPGREDLPPSRGASKKSSRHRSPVCASSRRTSLAAFGSEIMAMPPHSERRETRPDRGTGTSAG